MAAVHTARTLSGCPFQHCRFDKQVRSSHSSSLQPSSLWGRAFSKGRKACGKLAVRRGPCAAAVIANGRPGPFGNGEEAMWRRLQIENDDRIAIGMPKEVFVLADAGDDHDEELEDETLEEMDDDEQLFDQDSVEEAGEAATGSSSDEITKDRTVEVESPTGVLADTEETKSEVVATAEELEQEVLDEEEEDEEEGEEVELTWAQEKYHDLKQTVGVAVDRVPGPRVASSNMPWLIAVPLSYLAITLLISVAKVIKRSNTPRARRRKQVGRNAELVQLIDQYLQEDKSKLDAKGFKTLSRDFKFSPHEVLRKFIRYAIQERPFTPEMVSNLLLLRRSSGLSDKELVGVINDIAIKVVKSRGVLMMDTKGLTEKGLKKKAAVQAIFTKLLYLSELDEFLAPEARKYPPKIPPLKQADPTPNPVAAKDEPLVFRPDMVKKQQQQTGPSSEELAAERNHFLRIKEIFGLTDEDADKIRIDTLSDSDVVRLEDLLGRNTSGGADTSSEDEDGEDAVEKDEDS